jgi:hypothetical protein
MHGDFISDLPTRGSIYAMSKQSALVFVFLCLVSISPFLLSADKMRYRFIATFVIAVFSGLAEGFVLWFQRPYASLKNMEFG